MPSSRLKLDPRGRTDPMFLYSDPTCGSPYGPVQTTHGASFLDRRKFLSEGDHFLNQNTQSRPMRDAPTTMGNFTTSK